MDEKYKPMENPATFTVDLPLERATAIVNRDEEIFRQYMALFDMMLQQAAKQTVEKNNK
jgi:hypothetical protein